MGQFFLPVDDRCFALSFGHVHHNLKEVSYEYDFGLRVTLNCVDPHELKARTHLNPAWDGGSGHNCPSVRT
jgi:uncharacterized protein (TIGR04141 family)